MLFYLPRMLWLMMEGGLMKFFGKGTTTRIIEDPEEKRDKLVEVCTGARFPRQKIVLKIVVLRIVLKIVLRFPTLGNLGKMRS